LIVAAPFANPLRNVVFDAYQRLFPLERTTEPVSIVLIDEQALAAYGQWPWPRTRMAELITRIAELQPASIGMDMYFPEPDRFSPGMIADELPILPTNLASALRALPSNDQLFADAIRGHNVVIGISSDLPDPRFPNPPRAAPVVTKGTREVNLQTSAGHIGSVPPLEAAAASFGLMDSGQQDQVVRVIPLITRVQGDRKSVV